MMDDLRRPILLDQSIGQRARTCTFGDSAMVKWTRAGLSCSGAIVLGCFLGLAGLRAAVAADIGRGELLYNTHCIACHTSKMHWRDQPLAQDWTSLNVQVRRWQSSIQLDWNDEDIVNVAGYLNRLYYRFPEPDKDRVISGR
jgi:mono/diheme cytochrome c family protein